MEDPDILLRGALEQYGKLHVNTGAQFIKHWNSEYSSQVMPFVDPGGAPRAWQQLCIHIQSSIAERDKRQIMIAAIPLG